MWYKDDDDDSNYHDDKIITATDQTIFKMVMNVEFRG